MNSFGSCAEVNKTEEICFSILCSAKGLKYWASLIPKFGTAEDSHHSKFFFCKEHGYRQPMVEQLKIRQQHSLPDSPTA